MLLLLPLIFFCVQCSISYSTKTFDVDERKKRVIVDGQEEEEGRISNNNRTTTFLTLKFEILSNHFLF